MKKLLILDIDHTVTDPHDPAYDTPLDELFYNHPKVASISINKRFVNWYNERFPFDDIVFITGRTEALRDVTSSWLRSEFCIGDPVLFMRPDYIHYTDTPKMKGRELSGLLEYLSLDFSITIVDDNPACLFYMHNACKVYHRSAELYLVDKDGSVNKHEPAPLLTVVSGPSGVGKTTLVNMLCEHNTYIKKVVTTTTRKMRGMEVDGIDYHFVTPEKFEMLIEQKYMLEHAKVHGDLYGTQLQHVYEIIDTGFCPILILDVIGHRKVKERYGTAVLSIFIEPSSIDVLRERLKERGDSTDSIDRRLSVAVSEMAHKSYYDRVICNHDIKTAYEELKRCIDGQV